MNRTTLVLSCRPARCGSRNRARLLPRLAMNLAGSSLVAI